MSLRCPLDGKASSASLLITDRLRIQTDRNSELDRDYRYFTGYRNSGAVAIACVVWE